MKYDLERFVRAQQYNYDTALNEIKNGKKKSHWMWYVFPQLEGLGRSHFAKFYGIKNVDEAKNYLSHLVLGARLFEITEALLKLNESDPLKVMGSPDNLKLRSCMTLFACISEDDSIFHRVLNKYFGGSWDERTLKMIKEGEDVSC